MLVTVTGIAGAATTGAAAKTVDTIAAPTDCKNLDDSNLIRAFMCMSLECVEVQDFQLPYISRSLASHGSTRNRPTQDCAAGEIRQRNIRVPIYAF
jgi:hypothetical protein